MTGNISGIVASKGAKVLVIGLDPEACSTNTLLPDDGLDIIPFKSKAWKTKQLENLK